MSLFLGQIWGTEDRLRQDMAVIRQELAEMRRNMAVMERQLSRATTGGQLYAPAPKPN